MIKEINKTVQQDTLDKLNLENSNKKPIEYCPKCNKELVGIIEVKSAIIGGISIIAMEETTDRNWILCDYCNQTICKSCCVIPDSGYCNKCFFELKIASNLP